MKQQKIWILLLVLSLLLGGCGASPQEEGSAASSEIMDEESPVSAPSSTRDRAEILNAKPDLEKADHFEEGFADLSQTEKGFIAISYVCEDRLKFQVIRDEETYTYDLPSDGSVTIFPLNMGDGSYLVRVMKNIGETKYMKVWSAEFEVHLLDEFQPFLRPSQIVCYDPSDHLVEVAYELTKYASSDLEIAGLIYDYLKDNVTYDHEKAATVQSGYLPVPSSTLETKDGICFDYAALAASMLRSQGVPCQLITGYVGEDELYHAWNRIYTKEKGWLSVEISVNANDWKRVDITFAAGGTSATKLEDDSRYTDRFIY